MYCIACVLVNHTYVFVGKFSSSQLAHEIIYTVFRDLFRLFICNNKHFVILVDAINSSRIPYHFAPANSSTFSLSSKDLLLFHLHKLELCHEEVFQKH